MEYMDELYKEPGFEDFSQTINSLYKQNQSKGESWWGQFSRQIMFSMCDG